MTNQFGPITLVLAFAVALPEMRVGQAERPPAAADVELATVVGALLMSGEAMSIAWGGHWAGQHRLQQTVPVLIEVIATRQLQQPGIEWGAARDSVLDALILLNARPPAEIVARYFDQRPEHVLILLSEPQTGRDAVLLKLLRTSSGNRWHAAAGLLLEQRAPALAAELLGRLRLTVEVTVVDAQTDTRDRRVEGVSGGIGDGVLHPASGFPSIATYSLWDGAIRGGTVLSEGPHPIYYTRRASPPDFRPSGGSSLTRDGSPDAEERLAYLERLLNRWLPVKAVEAITIRWTTATRFRARISVVRNQLALRFKETVRLARDAGILSALEAGALSPDINVQILDHRGTKAARLPSVESLR